MAKIIPFRGFRYDPSRVEMRRVVAPPFDVISDEQRDTLYDRHPYNVVRLIRPKDAEGDGPGSNRYNRAREHLVQWIADGVLRRDESPCVYLYEQEYRYSERLTRARRGFITLVRLEEEESGVILGHEQTLMQPKLDRLNLLKECKANLSPIFALYSQPEGMIDSFLVETAFTPPAYDFVDDDGIRNRFWLVDEPAIAETLASQMQDKPLIIADGHHRYETALMYREIRRREERHAPDDAPYNYVMMMCVNLDGEGVTIYPMHRLIHGLTEFDPLRFVQELEKYFEIAAFPFSTSQCDSALDELLRKMSETSDSRHTFGLYLGGETLELLTAKDNEKVRELVSGGHSPNWRSLDVSIIQAVILHSILGIDRESISREEHVGYTPSASFAFENVRRGEAQAALFLNPTKPEQVKAVTYEGEKMPQKSTFFYPKLLSGLVINRHEP